MTSTIDLNTRFSFGKNWSNFLHRLNESRIVEAEKSLIEKLGVNDLKGKTFLDIGSGSGLFSLAAHRLGARVFSFDYDPQSVQCTQYLKTTYGQPDLEWSVEQGSVLDQNFLKKFGSVDIVYSWGVLHHTGDMNQAFTNVVPLVKKEGKLYISIYNDQGWKSRVWKRIKKLYVSVPSLRVFLAVFWYSVTIFYRMLIGMLKYGNPLKLVKNYGHNNRGMSAWHDVVDWVGGYPFEVGKPEDIFQAFKNKGFELDRLKTCAGGSGCNEFVFVKK